VGVVFRAKKYTLPVVKVHIMPSLISSPCLLSILPSPVTPSSPPPCHPSSHSPTCPPSHPSTPPSFQPPYLPSFFITPCLPLFSSSLDPDLIPPIPALLLFIHKYIFHKKMGKRRAGHGDDKKESKVEG